MKQQGIPKGAQRAGYDTPVPCGRLLVKAPAVLEKAVALCCRPQPFPNETKRIEFLFELYDQYRAGLFGKEEKQGRGKRAVV